MKLANIKITHLPQPYLLSFTEGDGTSTTKEVNLSALNKGAKVVETLACWMIGAGALECNTEVQLWEQDLERIQDC